jgi:hypothetical protein
MKLLESGKFAGMPFDWNDCPEVMEVFDEENVIDPSRTGLMDRKMAAKFQSIMTTNKTFFTDLMDEYGTDSLIYRIR